MCISHKFPGDAELAGPGAPFTESHSNTVQLLGSSRPCRLKHSTVLAVTATVLLSTYFSPSGSQHMGELGFLPHSLAFCSIPAGKG